MTAQKLIVSDGKKCRNRAEVEARNKALKSAIDPIDNDPLGLEELGYMSNGNAFIVWQTMAKADDKRKNFIEPTERVAIDKDRSATIPRPISGPSVAHYEDKVWLTPSAGNDRWNESVRPHISREVIPTGLWPTRYRGAKDLVSKYLAKEWLESVDFNEIMDHFEYAYQKSVRLNAKLEPDKRLSNAVRLNGKYVPPSLFYAAKEMIQANCIG